MPEQLKKRLFIALNLPERPKQALAGLIDKLKQRNPAIKWVKADGLHLTLHFLGYLDSELQIKLEQALKTLENKFSPLEFELSELNAFPDLNRPRVIFIGCRQLNGRTVYQLRQDLAVKLIGLGLEVDQRPWQPHLTLGRVKTAANPAGQNYRISQDKFIVKSFELMESNLTPAGAAYQQLASYRL